MNKKKLMILGGHYYLKPVIDKAHELGVYVITVDYLPNNAAHNYSDEYHNVSVIDKEAVLKLATELQIDGIISFVNDVAVVTAAYVAEKLQLSFQCSYKAAQILQDKGKFRSFLSDNNFFVPHAKRYTDKNAPFLDVDYFTWPVIVKPTDCAGSKAVTKVNSIDELSEAIDTAVNNSINGAFIIEDFLTFEGYHSSADLFTVEGELKFAVYTDQLFDSAAPNPYSPKYIIWPSTMKLEHQKQLTDDLQRIFNLLQVKSGIYNIETCVGEDGKQYIMEISPRGGGCRIAELQKIIYDIDLIENEIRQAVNMDIKEIKPKDILGCWCEMVVTPNKGQKGIYYGYSIDEKILNKNIKFIDVFFNIGDEVKEEIGRNITLGDIFLYTDTREEMEFLISTKDNWLKLDIR